MAASAGIEFWDYSEDSICQDRSLFYNSQHMTRQGGTLFTQKLAPRLKRALEPGRGKEPPAVSDGTSGGP